jgi:peptidase E
MKDTFQKAFAFHGLSISEMEACDARNASQFPELLKDRDVIILGGGHVPTQNAFFQQIGLKNMIQNYEGIVIGISAGTMNSAKTVYAQPEIEGESIDSEYQRFIPGLGLTEVMIIPHYQQVKNYYLDGKRVFEDITYPDSMGRKFYALVDGSYVLVQDGKTELYGEAYLIQDGKLTQICREGQKLEL